MRSILIAFLLCPVCLSFAQNRPQAYNNNVLIAKLDSVYHRYISNTDSTILIEKTLSGFSTEGGKLIVEYIDSSIVFINATFYGETGNVDYKFWYFSPQVFLIHYTFIQYDRSYGLENRTLVSNIFLEIYVIDNTIMKVNELPQNETQLSEKEYEEMFRNILTKQIELRGISEECN